MLSRFDMNNFFYGILITITAIVIISCEEEKETHPQVKSLPSQATSATSSVLKGEIVNVGDFKVKDYGFVYSTYGNGSEENGTKISLGSNAQPGFFETEISDPALFSNYGEASLTFRAFLTNEIGTAYGEPLKVLLPSLTIKSVEPLVAKEGDEIIIYGSNFKAGATDYEIFFNSSKGTISRVEADKIVVLVPGFIDFPYYYDRNIRITLKLGQQVIEATNSFYVEPTVADFSPKSGTFGTYVTITGSNFDSYYTQIAIGNLMINPTTISSNSLTFQIPSNVNAESLLISLYYGSKSFTFDSQFSILPPTITQITPLTGAVGEIVTISGTNFNDYSTRVTVGGVDAYVYSSSSSSLSLYIPDGLPAGAHQVKIQTGVHTITSSTNFTVISQ